MTRATDARLMVLILAACVASACASSGTLSGPVPFPTPPIAARGLQSGDEAPAATGADAVVVSALSLRGTPYRFGGSTPGSGFDCSGFVAYVLTQHAVRVPRVVTEQFAAGVPVAQDQLRAGDLVFFSTVGPGATHVGIVTDPDHAEFVHAPADGGSVRTERFDTTYWRSRYVGARRVL